MARQGKRTPSDRWRQIRISKERGKRGLARKGRAYSPDRWTKEHHPAPNPKFKLKGKARGRVTIEVPVRLNGQTVADWDTLNQFLVDLRQAALLDKKKRVLLDFRQVESLAPEAAVLIVAEIQRCRAFSERRTQITGTYPNSHDVSALLKDVGFFKALGIKAPELPDQFLPRSFVQIERHNSTVPEIADKLLDCFSEVFSFEGEDRRRLHIALVECMDNVFEHAYAKDSTRPDLTREWWLAGYADRTINTIGFTFYDQGSGIPTTIKTKKASRVRRLLHGWSDGMWIERAVRRGVSRHDSARRGHGLEKLREFIARLDVEGSLRVLANNGYVEFPSTGQNVVSDLTRKLTGTLVIWQLRGVEVQVPEQLSKE